MLAESSGLVGGLEGVCNQSIKHSPECSRHSSSIAERSLDGVALLPEAVTATRVTESFLDFMRLFERAFRTSAPRLGGPLAAFLDERFGSLSG